MLRISWTVRWFWYFQIINVSVSLDLLSATGRDISPRPFPLTEKYLHTNPPTYLPPSENTLKERYKGLVTFQTFDRSDEATWTDQQQKTTYLPTYLSTYLIGSTYLLPLIENTMYRLADIWWCNWSLGVDTAFGLSDILDCPRHAPDDGDASDMPHIMPRQCLADTWWVFSALYLAVPGCTWLFLVLLWPSTLLYPVSLLFS